MTDRRRPVLRLLVPVAALVLTALAAAPAQAHSDLVSSDPADGATLDQAPARVVLTFNEDVKPTGTAVVVTNADAMRVDDAAGLAVDGTDVTIPLDPTAASSSYTVAYRVVSTDGHVIEGTVHYTVAVPGEPAATTPTPTAEPAPTTASEDTPAWAIPLAVVGVAAALLGGVVVAARRARG